MATHCKFIEFPLGAKALVHRYIIRPGKRGRFYPRESAQDARRRRAPDYRRTHGRAILYPPILR